MNISTRALCRHIEQKMIEHPTLSVRCSYLLTTLCEQSGEHQQIDIFDLLTDLILLADKISAECIVDLLTLVTYEHSFDVLERDTVQKSAEFLRDYLKAVTLKKRGKL